MMTNAPDRGNNVEVVRIPAGVLPAGHPVTITIRANALNGNIQIPEPKFFKNQDFGLVIWNFQAN
jgi:hypothetical protein